MMKLRNLIFSAALLALGLPAAAQNTFMLSVSPANAQSVISGHGLTVIKELYDGSICVYLVSSPSTDTSEVEAEVESDLRAVGFEPDQIASLPELSGLTQATLTQSNTSILDTLPGRTLVSFFGSTVPSNYTTQAATNIIRLSDARTATHLTGAGVVGIIDTGADPNHPALLPALVPGYDFTRETTFVSEFNDLDPALAARLQQSNTSILDAQNVLLLNSYTAILAQSNTSILDQSNTSILDSTYPDFGHGTMVAGIVHLIAPTAKIMPLKAFRADGTSNLSDIVRAIYFAADHGVNVLSMSFSMQQSSPGLQAAIQYALGKNVTLIAASGNDGLKTLVFPASYNGVEGIGSTSNLDVRSTFSNYGSGVTLFAAPGEGVITTFPGGGYAAAWGTSFSTPIVAGAASLVIQARPASKPGDVINALSKAKQISDMGYGRIDLYVALTNWVLATTSGTGTGSTSGGSSK
jgi:subtilisin family serine protease